MTAPLPRASGLDPRTKLVLAVVVAVVMIIPDGLRFAVPALLGGVLLAVSVHAWRRAAGLVVGATVAETGGWLLPVWWPTTFSAIVASGCVYVIRFIAIAGVGVHLIATTSPTQLSAALRAWRIPRAIVVTVTVMLRFFPVVVGEATGVIDAMRLRGLTGVGGLLRHPILGVERFTIPMIASSLRAAEDLSASAILRGLGSRRRPNAMIPPRFRWIDLAAVLVAAALAVTAVLLPSVPT